MCSAASFASSPTKQAAARWFAEREMPVSLLAMDEAFKLGQIRFADIILAEPKTGNGG